MTGIHNTPGDGAGYTNTVCPHLFVAPDDLVAGRLGLGVVALRYAALGLPVFPLKPGTKKPDCKNGFKDATTDPAVIERWWTENRFRGIGIATGAVSGAAIVDLDRKNGKDGPASFAAWSAGLGLNLPWRPWAGTPSGGIHELWRLPGSRSLGSRVGVLDGVDIRADGGYVAAWPTGIADVVTSPERPRGETVYRTYEWHGCPCQAPAMPLKLLDALAELPGTGPGGTGGSGWTSPDIPALVAGGIPPGMTQRPVLRDVVWKLVAEGKNDAEIKAVWDQIVARTVLTQPSNPWTKRHFNRELKGAREQQPGMAAFPPESRAEIMAHAQTMVPAMSGSATAPAAAGKPARRPEIFVNKDQGRLIAEARQALVTSNQPLRLFRHGRVLCRIGVDDEGRRLITAMDRPGIRADLARAIGWRKETKTGGIGPAGVPAVVADDLTTHADQLTGIPVVRQIVTAPVFAPDGTLETVPGYIASAQVWYEPVDGMVVPPVPEVPTRAQVNAATQLLLTEYLGDFPLKAPSDWAHIFALMVLPFVRTMIAGPTPNHGVSAPTPGTGKGKLATAALLPALGRMLPATPEVKDEDEMRKQLTAIFLAGQQVIRFDNLQAPMRSPSVSLALTEPVWQDRILGVSSEPAQRVLAIWVMTGNNLSYSQEIARRTVPVLLDLAETVAPVTGPDGRLVTGADGRFVTGPQIRWDRVAHAERPWQRTGFAHPDLLGWGTQHRGELVGAILTIVRGWLGAGRPPFTGKPLGSFEEWSRVVGGITGYAGCAGFLEGTGELYDSAVSDADEKAAFLERWLARFGEKPVPVGELTQFAAGGADPFGIASDWMSGRAAETAAGMALRHLDGAVWGGIRVRKWGRHGYAAQRIA